MRLKILTSFKVKLNDQVEFIAKDKPSAARKFKSEIIGRIKALTQMPYKNRKSIFFDREDIREIIYKGYIVVYKINERENAIEVFGLTKYEDNPFK
ncbi:MAG: type II toxin-antitoxin system RelE/ParE family toxin [Bacteroidota bacterium]|nr:type II toxin-antitoxin system RelE/ParE family toxin [Bacteroidota bacterium]